MKKNTLVIALAAVLFSSCNMDFYPVSSIDDSTAIRSVEDAQKVANYFNIRLRGLYAGSYIYSSEIATDIFHPTIGYGNRGGDYFRWEMTSETGVCESLWASCYASISNANYLIAKIDELDKTDLTEAELIAAFGEPSAYSDEYVAAFSDDEKLKSIKKNRLVRWLIATLLGIIALIGMVIAAATIYDAFNTEYYYFEQTITDEGKFNVVITEE